MGGYCRETCDLAGEWLHIHLLMLIALSWTLPLEFDYLLYPCAFFVNVLFFLSVPGLVSLFLMFFFFSCLIFQSLPLVCLFSLHILDFHLSSSTFLSLLSLLFFFFPQLAAPEQSILHNTPSRILFMCHISPDMYLRSTNIGRMFVLQLIFHWPWWQSFQGHLCSSDSNLVLFVLGGENTLFSSCWGTSKWGFLSPYRKTEWQSNSVLLSLSGKGENVQHLVINMSCHCLLNALHKYFSIYKAQYSPLKVDHKIVPM